MHIIKDGVSFLSDNNSEDVEPQHLFLRLNLQMNQQVHNNERENRTQAMRFYAFTFTGNDPRKGWRIPLNEIKYNEQRDEETGYGYFGARYMDHELMTMWLSVDPMADKYPNMSPYNYCAGNPVKLVDPDGREIDVSGLSEAMQQRLANCFWEITGLNLKVENGLLISIGKDPNNTSYSQSAQDDLLAAISNKEIKVAAQESDEYDDTYGGDWATIENHDIYISSSLHVGNEDYDAKTEGLGMSFLHELGHAYFGDIDPAPDPDSFIERTFDKRQPYPCCGVDLGGAVSRVNKYRTEMGMPLRASYESYSYRKGEPESWRKFEGQVAFREGNSIV